MSINVPELLIEQLEIINWANTCLTNGLDRAQVVESLLATDAPPPAIQGGKYKEARSLYLNYNGDNRYKILLAILLGSHTFKTQFSEGQLVTDGNTVGYAGRIDYVERKFYLYPSKQCLQLKTSYTGKYDVFDFRPMKESDLDA